MHSSAELVKAIGAIIGALAFFVVVIHQITRLLG
jgi:flagellar biogenesis protein FliO